MLLFFKLTMLWRHAAAASDIVAASWQCQEENLLLLFYDYWVWARVPTTHFREANLINIWYSASTLLYHIIFVSLQCYGDTLQLFLTLFPPVGSVKKKICSHFLWLLSLGPRPTTHFREANLTNIWYSTLVHTVCYCLWVDNVMETCFSCFWHCF
jgi:hypothetical protein